MKRGLWKIIYCSDKTSRQWTQKLVQRPNNAKKKNILAFWKRYFKQNLGALDTFQCTLGSLNDKKSPNILHFQCLVGHKITSAWIQYMLLCWVGASLRAKEASKEIGGILWTSLSLEVWSGLGMLFWQRDCKCLRALIWYNILHQAQPYIGSYQ